ncbi:MAG: glycosyltransferase family 2 protein [Candidatus Edwardsbacteria bacterium]
MKIAVVIPAYNAGETLPLLLKETSRFIGKKDIIVVDDGSKDNTSKVVQQEGVVLLSHQKNQGKGAALVTGFVYALKQGYEAVITLDADGQHRPSYIPQFIKQTKNKDSDIVVGSRRHDLKGMPFDRFLTNRITAIVVSLLGGVKIEDSQSGYRLIKTKVLQSVPILTHRYEAEDELLIKAGRKRYIISSIFIPTIYGTEKSHINKILDTLLFIVLAIKSLWQ